MRLANGIVIDKEAAFGNLKFSTLRHEVHLQNKDGEVSDEIKNLTSINGYTFNFYAIWDYAPDLDAYDRYFTLYEAQTGVITESELLRTVKSIDREDGTTQVRVKNYSPSMFTSFTSAGEITIT